MRSERDRSVAGRRGLAAGAAGCGSGGGTSEVAAAPEDAAAEVSGTLRVFAYEDSVIPELIDPVLEANPELTIDSATFDSNDEAAAKLAGGFEADVVEVCLDEMDPLLAQNLLRPLDPAGVEPGTTSSSPTPRASSSTARRTASRSRPASRASSTTPRRCPEGIDEIADLFDPQFAGRSTIQGSYALPAIAEGALALGIEDPMNLTPEELEQTKDYLVENRDQFRTLWNSDSDLVNLFKSGEVVVAAAGPQLAQRIIDAGVPAKWAPAKEGTLSWVCGFAITSKAQNIPAAYALINSQSSPEAQAIRAEDGYLVTNRKALELAGPEYRGAPASRRRPTRSPRPIRPITRTGSRPSKSSSPTRASTTPPRRGARDERDHA